MMIKGVENRAVNFDFRWTRACAGGAQAASIESISLRRRSAGPPWARGPIGGNRSNRLKTGPS